MTSIELAQPHGRIKDRNHSQVDLNALERNDSVGVNVRASDDAPPNGGYGWVCTLCAFLIIVHTWGINGAWGVILAHFLSNSTFPGASRIEYALISGLAIAQCFLLGPIVSNSQRHLGTRITLLLGTGFVFASLMGAAYSQQIWHLFLSQGVCFSIGMGFLYITSMSVLPSWFSTHRSLAIGIAGSGCGIGGLLYSLVAGHIIETQGVRMTYMILAFCALSANLVASLLLRSREKAHVDNLHKRLVDHRDLKRPEVLLTTDLGYIALVYSLPNYATSIGLNTQQGSVAGAMLNLGLTIGRPLVGYLSDRFGRITVPTALTAFCGLTCL